MAIAFACPQCGKANSVNDEHSGRRARCACGITLDVPAMSDQPPPLPPPLPRAEPPIAILVATPAASRTPWLILGGVGIGVVATLGIVAVIFVARASSPGPTNMAGPIAIVQTSPRLAPPAVARPVAPPQGEQWSTSVPGVRSMRLSVPNGAGLNTQLIVYLPADANFSSKLPCVFVAPAGSRLFHGMNLEDGDAREHLPYVKAGFAVVAYSIGGPIDESRADDPRAMKAAYDVFARSEAGLIDARAAMDYAGRKRPEIDKKRFYVAGHSSAATLALLIAANDDRVRGCCAYAPQVNVVNHFRPNMEAMSKLLPNFGTFTLRFSPDARPKPKGKLMLFYAKDDDVINIDELNRYGRQSRAEIVSVPSGGHVQPMIDTGIAAGICFLTAIDATLGGAQP